MILCFGVLPQTRDWVDHMPYHVDGTADPDPNTSCASTLQHYLTYMAYMYNLSIGLIKYRIDDKPDSPRKIEAK